jgi:apolipoprotein N-acyltransferase
MTTSSPPPRPLAWLDRHPAAWLVLGALLLFLSQMRFGIGALAWLAPVPWLRFLRLTSRWPSRLTFALVGGIAWTLTVAKILTSPLPLAFAPLFGVPIASFLVTPYLATPLLRKHFGEVAAAVGFTTTMVTGEWLLHTALPMGTWGSAGDTQVEHLALLQLASVTGLHGVSALVYLFAATAEGLLAAPSRRRVRTTAAVLGAVLLVVAGGQLRLALSTAAGTDLIRVAAVGTDSRVGLGPLPAPEEVERVRRGLFARTRAAARSGAELVVWTEAATAVWPEEEPAFLEAVAEVAEQERVAIVAGYVVPLDGEPLVYRNRYAFLTAAGVVDHVYDKHVPVPGEPTIAGAGPMPVVEDLRLGRVSGAICYDYDFPRLGLAHAAADIDLVALPASDWRGIDPIHAQMASVRAIEGGHSLVRSTRFGLSAGFDPYGRPRGWLSHFDGGDRVLVMSLPRHGLTTVYGTLGDWFPIACALLSALSLLAAARRRLGYGRAWPTRSSPSPVARSSTPAASSDWTSTAS